MYETVAIARKSVDDKQFYRISIKRNEPGPNDVELDIKYCGICHTDVHIANNDTGNANYPCVPGHELAGIVTKVGSKVGKVKVGDHAGVGCVVDSCMNCTYCSDSQEQYCRNGFTMTYNTKIRHGHIATDSGYTYGGYSKSITVAEKYIIKIPMGYPLECAGPVFCAGITMYSPLKHWGAVKGGKRVGIVGIGGLGQMGIRLAHAMGNKVTAISTSVGKRDAALAIGASNFVVSTDEDSMKKATKSLDLILNTVSANHEAGHYLTLLDNDGTLVLLGVVSKPYQLNHYPMMLSRLSLASSLIGGIAETQECIDFCHQKNIKPEIAMVESKEKVPGIYDVLNGKNDSIKRYVIDINKCIK